MVLEAPLSDEKVNSGRSRRSSAGRIVIGRAITLGLSRRTVLPAVLAVLSLLAWEGAVAVFKIPTVILAPPSAIFVKLYKFYPMLLENSVSTTTKSLIAFFATVTLGIVLAAAITYSELLYDMLYPNLVFFQLIPKIALAPLFILWFGIHYNLAWHSRFSSASSRC